MKSFPLAPKIVGKRQFFFIVLSCIISLFTFTNNLQQVYADDNVEECTTSGIDQERSYCHCVGNQILCPVHTSSFFTGDHCDATWIKQTCDTNAGMTCVDSVPNSKNPLVRDVTHNNARCVQTGATPTDETCTCNSPTSSSWQANQNSRTCVSKTDPTKKTQRPCGPNQACGAGGTCQPLRCFCRHNSGTDPAMVCLAPGDTTSYADLSKLPASKVSEASCPTTDVCVNTPGSGDASCKDKSAAELGKCTCSADKKSVICANGGNDCGSGSCVDGGANGAQCTTGADNKRAPSAEPTEPPPPSPPCTQGAWKDGQCQSLVTALGELQTDPSGFTTRLFAILLSFSGGIALLLIIRAGYQLMTSQGKPDQVQAGRDQLIAAIVGLAFLIFSLVLLQVIGYDILRIPGFGPAKGGTLQTGASCDANNDQCAAGSTCVSQGTGNGRTGVCKSSTSAACDVNGSNQCPAGQTCVSQGTGNGRSGVCR